MRTLFIAIVLFVIAAPFVAAQEATNIQWKSWSELETALEEELEIERYYIADTKQEIIIVDKYTEEDHQTLNLRRQRLKDRKHALQAFEDELKELERAKRTMQRFQLGVVYRVFAAWLRYVAQRQTDRALVAKVYRRVDQLQYRAAFDKWKLVSTEYDVAVTCPEGVIGMGGKSLALVNRHRTTLEAEASEILGSVRQTNALLVETGKTNEQRQLALKSAYA